MLTTDKDFDGISDNNHPTTYYIRKGETKPLNNVINGAVLIEMDPSGNEVGGFIFERDTKTWIPV